MEPQFSSIAQSLDDSSGPGPNSKRSNISESNTVSLKLANRNLISAIILFYQRGAHRPSLGPSPYQTLGGFEGMGWGAPPGPSTPFCFKKNGRAGGSRLRDGGRGGRKKRAAGLLSHLSVSHLFRPRINLIENLVEKLVDRLHALLAARILPPSVQGHLATSCTTICGKNK